MAESSNNLATRTICDSLIEIGRQFYGRGWVLGTSGNFSAVTSRTPVQLAITASGVDKGDLKQAQILLIDSEGTVLDGAGKPSDETQLHLMVVRVRGANAVLHTHSVWSTILSDALADQGGVEIEGYEMLKGLAGVRTHAHREWLPIIKNSQDLTALAGEVEERLRSHPQAHGFLLQGHGLYTWGQSLNEARRHIEIFEFLLEVTGRRQQRFES
ncbi:MAG TPA: methylthioribulose 1-phosphate dehydratase [Blastocatellia bacterium]|nr:methylthioribulose 1-phosphate dehydratase [Blastocatellia bacterium]